MNVMIDNQLRYAELLETTRANRANEDLQSDQLEATNRRHQVDSAETRRSNLATENLRRQTLEQEYALAQQSNTLRNAELQLTEKRDRNSEALRSAELVETSRSNLAREGETYRSNVARETETHRSNTATETETMRSNLAREYETNRSNVARETETNRSNLASEELQRMYNQELARSNRANESLRADELNVKWYQADTDRLKQQDLAEYNKLYLQAYNYATDKRYLADTYASDISRANALSNVYLGYANLGETRRYHDQSNYTTLYLGNLENAYKYAALAQQQAYNRDYLAQQRYATDANLQYQYKQLYDQMGYNYAKLNQDFNLGALNAGLAGIGSLGRLLHGASVLLNILK